MMNYYQSLNYMKQLCLSIEVNINERFTYSNKSHDGRKKAIYLAILLGFIAAISSIGLLGTGGYLLSQAALHPPLYTLTLTIILVRFFGLTRSV
ncbi:hypothetical protein KHA80_15355 [Anaerobacillus sp. HL2]|nr:hypothetical protein KHA80_15355 [Anaerobacillus sp. HL2]